MTGYASPKNYVPPSIWDRPGWFANARGTTHFFRNKAVTACGLSSSQEGFAPLNMCGHCKRIVQAWADEGIR